MGKFRIVYTSWKTMEIEADDAKDAEHTFWQEGYGGDIENANFAYADDITNAEYVYHEPGYEAEWICICGNTASDDGFYAIDEGNHEVEPTEEDWKTNQYVCGDCGRVIDNATRRVVRHLKPATIVRLE
jgi:hypothetical protein